MNSMNKKGQDEGMFSRLSMTIKVIKQSYLCRLVSKFLSVVCSIILVVLLIIGGMMFFFNVKSKAYQKNGMEYTSPFGLYTIVSGSMEPNIEVYDVVVAAETDISTIRVGDVVTFISNWSVNSGVTVTHRVVEIATTENGEYQLTTKGDNNQAIDGGYVTQRNLIGKVVGRIPQLGQLQFFLATKIGWFLIVFIPALIVIILDGIKIFKLYFLKEKIENVKGSDDAIKEIKQQEKEAKIKEIKSINEAEAIQKVANDNAVKKDFSIELPKIDDPRLIADSKMASLDDYTIPLPKIEIDEKEAKNLNGTPAVKPSSPQGKETKSTGLPIINESAKTNTELPQIKKPINRK